METTKKTTTRHATRRTTRKQPSAPTDGSTRSQAYAKKHRTTPTDPHERLVVYLETENVAGVAELYCHNHIERRHEKPADALTREDILAISAYFGSHPEHVELFAKYIVMFRALIECNVLAGCVMAEYKLALTRLAQTVAQALFSFNDMVAKLDKEMEVLQQKVDALKQGKTVDTSNITWQPLNETLKKLGCDTVMDDVIFYQKQYVSVMAGYMRMDTDEREMEHFIPCALKRLFFSFKDGRRDVVVESVRTSLEPTPAVLETFNQVVEKQLPKMADVEIMEGYADVAPRLFNLLVDAMTQKDINTLL